MYESLFTFARQSLEYDFSLDELFRLQNEQINNFRTA
jgi:hypothetical protein